MKDPRVPGQGLLREFGVPVPKGDGGRRRRQDGRDGRRAARRPGVVKAQVHAGGRGKARRHQAGRRPGGGRDARRGRSSACGSRRRRRRPRASWCARCCVEEASAIERELYLSITLDRARATHVVMASPAGGMDIEEVAARTPGEDPPRVGAPGARPRRLPGAAPGLRPRARRRAASSRAWR